MWCHLAVQQNMWVDPQQKAEKKTSIYNWCENETTVSFNLTVPEPDAPNELINNWHDKQLLAVVLVCLFSQIMLPKVTLFSVTTAVC